jgi:hypothetical protein
VDRGGLHRIDVKLSGGYEVQKRIGWADGVVQKGDLVVTRCLNEDGGSLVVLRSESKDQGFL